MSNDDHEATVRQGRAEPYKQLPDAVMDDDDLSNEAKLSYWYLKRIASFEGRRARVSVGRLAKKLHFSSSSKRSARSWIEELVKAGWVDVEYRSHSTTDGKIEHLVSEYIVHSTAQPPATEAAARGVGAGEPLGSQQSSGGVRAEQHRPRGSGAPRVGAGEPPCSKRVSSVEGSNLEGSKPSSRAQRSTDAPCPPGKDPLLFDVDQSQQSGSDSGEQDQGRHGGDQLLSKRQRGTRIATPFAVTSEMVAWAREHAPDVDGRRETDRFVDHFIAKTGPAATKLDWAATWRNWMRTAQDRLPARRNGSQGRQIGTTDRKIAEAELLKDNPNPRVLALGGLSYPGPTPPMEFANGYVAINP